ncbi:amidohydrolase [Nocardia sp. NPDC058499]|uniref:amidohydrolase n=1 Tax=Nocardia sp. NPDC058499 TaxID=3346530 RepID=UPI0036516637
MTTTPNETFFINGRVKTMDKRQPSASTVRIRGGRIVEVGDGALAAANTAPSTNVVDLNGRWLLPGFIDAHNHLSISALFPRWVDLSPVQTPDDLRQALVRQAESEPDAPWIRGANWWGFLPIDRDLLDSFGFDRPIMIGHTSCHDGVVDSRGLDILGISEESEDPRGGLRTRDSRGRLTGALYESAFGPAYAASIEGFDDPEQYDDALATRARAFLQEGITAIHDAACSPEAEAAYRRLAAKGALPVSVLAMPHSKFLFSDNRDRRIDGPATGEGDEWYRVGPVKFFADGGQVPAFSADHGHTGILNESMPEALAHAITLGFRVAVHAIGDVAMNHTLSAFLEAARTRPDDDHRFRVEHGFFSSPKHISDMAELGVIASVQPGMPEMMSNFLDSHGEHVHGNTFRFRDMAEAGITISASSDDPCMPYGPLLNMQAASIRRTGAASLAGDQTLAREDWLHAFTAGAAYAGGQENERGSITVGKRADLVVLDGELDSNEPPAVDETWVNGAKVWARESTSPR